MRDELIASWMITAKQATAFWKKVDVRSPSECWPWMGATFRKGYGNCHLRPRNIGAHIVAYLLANDDSVGFDDVVMHSCDNPPCCNPAHVCKATQLLNLRDSIVKGRFRGSDNFRLEHKRNPWGRWAYRHLGGDNDQSRKQDRKQAAK